MGGFTNIIVCGLVLCAVAASARLFVGGPAPPTNLPTDFSANVSINEAGQKLTGFLYHDYTGRRSYLFINELSQYTFTFQPFGSTELVAYTITTSGCTCQITTSAQLEPYFAQIVTASASTKGCSGGTLFVNSDFANLTVAPDMQFCISSGGDVISAGTSTQTTTFSNFKAGRTTPFPTQPLAGMIDECNSACL